MRQEYKYLVPNYLVDDVRAAITPFVDVDPYAARSGGAYTVRSIYLDSADLTCYWEKEAGIKDRKKLRVRGYNLWEANAQVFLEIKRKTNNLIWKNRALMRFDDLETLLEFGDPDDFVRDSPRDRSDARKFCYHLRRQAMVPIETVIYEREPFVCRFDSSLRVTLDRNLRSVAFPSLDGLFEEEDVQPALPDHFILEIKFDADRGFPRWVRPFLARFDLSKQALSKYCICLDTHSIARLSRDTVVSRAVAPGVLS